MMSMLSWNARWAGKVCSLAQGFMPPGVSSLLVNLGCSCKSTPERRGRELRMGMTLPSVEHAAEWYILLLKENHACGMLLSVKSVRFWLRAVLS